MWGQLLSSFASGIVSPFVGYFNNKQQLNAQLQQNRLALLKAQGDRAAALVSQGLAADANWEMESIKAGQQYRGFELFVVSIPLVLCFTPWHQIAADGLAAISKTPEWYQLLVMSIFLANYGVRFWRR